MNMALKFKAVKSTFNPEQVEEFGRRVEEIRLKLCRI
jgi:hypothetical protein